MNRLEYSALSEIEASRENEVGVGFRNGDASVSSPCGSCPAVEDPILDVHRSDIEIVAGVKRSRDWLVPSFPLVDWM